MGDGQAARDLLRHSVRLGHSRLAIRRFFLARAMGMVVPEDDERYCAAILTRLPPDTVEKMVLDARWEAQKYLNGKSPDG